MANQRIIVSDVDSFINFVNANLVHNFKAGESGHLSLPSLHDRALALVNRDQVYLLEDETVDTGNEEL